MHIQKCLLFTCILFFGANGFSQSQRWYPYKSQTGEWFFVNETKERLNEQPFDSLMPFYREQAFVQRDGKWGVIDTSGKEITPIQHQSVQFVNSYTRQFYLVGDKNGQNGEWRWGVVNLKGDHILPIAFQHIELLLRNFGNYSKPICFVAELPDSTNSKGLYDTEGNKLVEHEYEKIVSFPTDRYTYDRDYCLVLTKNETDRKVAGAYNVSEKNWIFPCEYDAENVIDEWYNIRIDFNRRLRKVPLTKEPFLYVYKGVGESFKRIHNCYSIKGELLLACEYSLRENGLFEFIYADSVVATSEWGFYDVISETPEVYQLSIMDSTGIASAAIFSSEKGMVVPPGVFKYDPNIELKDGKLMLTRIQDGTWRAISMDGTIGEILQQSSSQLPRSKWIERETEFGSYRYNREKKRIIVYDLKGKRRASLRRIKHWNIDGMRNELLYVERKESFSIYNMETQRFAFKNQRNVSKETLDSLPDGHLLILSFQQGESFFELFSQKKGWAFYDENGQLLKQAPTRSLWPMRPIEVNGALGGIIWFDHSKGENSSHYELFSGLRLGDLDAAYSVQYDSEKKEYYAYDMLSIYRGYDEEGKELFSVRNISSHQNGIAGVETLDGGFNLCDSNYQLLFDQDFSRIDRKGNDFYIGSRNGNYYFISTKESPRMGKGYTYYERPLNSMYVCTNPDGSVDALSPQGEMLYENCDSIKWDQGYFVIRSQNTEYWLTPKLIVYGSHPIVQN